MADGIGQAAGQTKDGVVAGAGEVKKATVGVRQLNGARAADPRSASDRIQSQSASPSIE